MKCGRQGISLGSSCFQYQTAIHEIGHAIGFHHEQNRPDRDKYIRVLYNNIKPGIYTRRTIITDDSILTDDNTIMFFSGARNQFDIRKDIDSLGVGYDYNSIMHYNDDFYARSPGLKTLVPIAPGIILGSASDLSPLDILLANLLYNCSKHEFNYI